MYYYVYDEFVQDPKFERELAQIETRLTDLGVSGKIARLALFRDATELIKDEVRKGAKTIVAVGNDLTLRKVIDAAADLGAALGIIPLGNGENNIARILGIPSGVAACDVISARIIEEIDTGAVNGQRFINSLVIEDARGIAIDIEGKYRVTPIRNGSIEVRNLAMAEADVPVALPTDGSVELVIRTPEKSWFGKKKNAVSLIPVEDVMMFSERPVQIRVDGELFEGQKFRVSVIHGQLRMITGKDRAF